MGADLERLTPREREILKLIGRQQLSSKEVAPRANISPKRVDEICATAARKLGVATRREAVRLVLGADSGYDLDPPPDRPGENPRPGLIGVPETFDSKALRPVYGRRGDADAATSSGDPWWGSSDEHGARRTCPEPDLGRPGEGTGGDRLASEPPPGPRRGDGALEAERLSSGGAHPQLHPDRHRHARRPGLHSWVTGGTDFAELTPPQRLAAVFRLVAALGALIAWTLTAVLQTSNVLQHWWPKEGVFPHHAWIPIGVHYEEIRSRRGGRSPPPRQ
jgi:DNA-binding CsgD family transcriptional regulator